MTVLERVRAQVGDDSVPEELLLAYIEDAKGIILNRRYPFGYPEGTEVEAKYETVQVKIALELFSKRGAEGQVSHSENGISRGYESASVSPSLINMVIPKVGSVGVVDAESE